MQNADIEHTTYGIEALAEEKIIIGEDLLDQLTEYKPIEGVTKIERKIQQEIKFLKKVLTTHQVKINHISCSNLVHFNYLVQTLSRTADVQHLDYPVKVGGNRKATGRVDIVADHGRTWIKVIARNPKALSDVVNGEASYGTKSILDHAEYYAHAARENPCRFVTPKVIFDFANSISNELVNALTEKGVDVRIDGQSNVAVASEIVHEITTLNLDITTLLTYVSAQANGHANWEFEEPLLNEQASKERRNPVKPFLDSLFEGKELIVCKTAEKDFLDIVETLGGQHEKIRTEKFRNRLKILPDISAEELALLPQLNNLAVNGKIKPRSLRIFAFGMNHRAMTVSSNEGFVRSAKMQGIEIPCILHEARYLTEMKEPSAKQVNDC